MRALALLLVGALPAGAETLRVTYDCDASFVIRAAFVNDAEPGRVALSFGEASVVLRQEPSGSGIRYGVAEGAPGHVWLGKGDEGMLLWRDADGAEDVLIGGCVERPG